MKYAFNSNTRESLKNELRNEFPELTETDFDMMEASFENFVTSLSLKVQRNPQEMALVITNKLQYIQSKGI